jgi:hypothetical protein
MQVIKEEVKNYIIKYKAEDGTVFLTDEECRAYESTAKYVTERAFASAFRPPEPYEMLGGDFVPFADVDGFCAVYAVKIHNVDELEIYNRYAKTHGIKLASVEDMNKTIVLYCGEEGLNDWSVSLGTTETLREQFNETIKILERMADNRACEDNKENE